METMSSSLDFAVWIRTMNNTTLKIHKPFWFYDTNTIFSVSHLPEHSLYKKVTSTAKGKKLFEKMSYLGDKNILSFERRRSSVVRREGRDSRRTKWLAQDCMTATWQSYMQGLEARWSAPDPVFFPSHSVF